jgi:hypothetical protein
MRDSRKATLIAAAAMLPVLAASLLGGRTARAQAPAASRPAPAAAAKETGGIQWFARLKDGLAEARRTGKPILFLSAAPSCGGVPGVW